MRHPIFKGVNTFVLFYEERSSIRGGGYIVIIVGIVLFIPGP